MPPRRTLAPGFRIGSSMDVRFSDDDRLLASLGQRPTLWDVQARKRLGTFPLLSQAMYAAFAPDGAQVAVKNTAGVIAFYDTGTLEQRDRWSGRGRGEGSRHVFSPCGAYLIDGTWSGHLTARRVGTGEVVWSDHQPEVSVFRLAGARDRRLIAYDRFERGVHHSLFIHRWPLWEHEPELLTGPRAGDAVALSDDHQWLAVEDDGLQIWNINDPTNPRRTARRGLRFGGTGPGLAWSPDGDHLAVAAGGTGRLFTRELEPVLSEPVPMPCAAHVTASGHLVAFGSWSKGIALASPSAAAPAPPH